MLKIYYGHIQLVRDPLVFDKWFEKIVKDTNTNNLRSAFFYLIGGSYGN